MSELASLRLVFRAMGCEGAVCLCGPERERLVHAAAQAQAEVARIEAKYSRYLPNSVTSRLHAAAGAGWVATDAETDSLLAYADALWQQSEGLFDLTAGVLRRVWDFRSGQLPGAQALKKCLSLVGWERVQRRPGGVCLPADMEIDFGGIGKEYAADRAAAVAASLGAWHGWVNLGGDIALIDPSLAAPQGAVPDGAAHLWHIAIAHPRPQAPGQVMAHLAMTRGGLATSGDNERFMEVAGKRYCHILNPRTGWPVAHWQSVSVVAASATAAGSLSTIAMLKEAQAEAWLRAQNVQFLAVDGQGLAVRHLPSTPVMGAEQPPVFSLPAATAGVFPC